MEASLARYYGDDIRDRWRVDESGRRVLTLRMIAVRLRYLPQDSPLSIELRDGREHIGLTQLLLADVWQAAAQSKREHPLIRNERTTQKRREMSALTSPKRARAMNDFRRRAAKRRARIAAGEIT